MKPIEILAASKKIDLDGLGREVLDTALDKQALSEQEALDLFNSDWIQEFFNRCSGAVVAIPDTNGTSLFNADPKVVKTLVILSFLAGIAFRERLSGIEELERLAK